MDFEKGEVLLFDKPLKWTSFDLVRKVRGLIRIKKVGHAGTLDPLATGLMIICTGKMTKQIDTFQAQIKEYTGTFKLGATTPCYDMEQPEDATFPTEHISEQMIREMVNQFTGVISQMPPPHSAVKVDGKRAYELARKGKEVVMKPREVTIEAFEITGINMPEVSFRIVCSKGTYIRSIAHDFGMALGSGAYLTSLCRTRIGEFRLEDAMQLTDFSTLVSAQNTKSE
ncbi:MAG: tRNA pseudouridine(55) synthase TruB [Bacteroidetes bacterium]|nr:tRNA pseudouridine(55) synthase TruB [Bacteroidota bacterium]MBK9422800.1 tRNA pseudouridine(55) synthase TruB [Bacteroidota bacterium]MBL0074099.1 tRNA pseudouridine(55) synthase TruB [Bacteroidota bacterium]